MKANYFLAIAFAASPCLDVYAQAAETPALSPGKPEEIVVTGNKPLRERMMEAQQRTFALFNEFNDENRFDIFCETHETTGSHFATQNCEPQFILDARQSMASDYKTSLSNFLDLYGIPDGSVSAQHIPAEAAIANQLPAYRSKMKQVAEEHPEFLQSLIEYTNLKREFERKK